MEWSGLRVLVVEDHEFQRRTLMRLLESRGASEVHGSANGVDALAWLDQAGPIDIVITDLDMPHMDGIELIRHIAERHVTRAVIVASGLEPSMLQSVETMARAYGLQVLGNVEKPLTSERLALLVDRYQTDLAPRVAADSQLTVTREEALASIAAGEFFPVYQPKVQFSTGRLIGAEALARWKRLDTSVSAAQFIQRLEAEGCISALTDFMISRAAGQQASWRRLGLDINVAINISVLCLDHVQVADRYEKLVCDAGCDPASITLELTETAVIPEAAHALDVLTRLRLKGFGLSVDDFGTGYSSLKQLHSIPFSELKIDQVFVRGALDNARQQTILLGGLDLGRRLKLRTVAEGIETRQEWDLVKGLGCDIAQGYFLSRPLPPDEFVRWAEQWHAMVE